MTEVYDYLINQALELKSKVTVIEHQIELRKLEADEDGIKLDKKWLAKAKYAKNKTN